MARGGHLMVFRVRMITDDCSSADYSLEPMGVLVVDIVREYVAEVGACAYKEGNCCEETLKVEEAALGE